ncbi:MAG: hypothetical protein JWO59_3540 [Chloroflexi bacterium]|nr:hypothetical protein [Chloroflexota bacterium]
MSNVAGTAVHLTTIRPLAERHDGISPHAGDIRTLVVAASAYVRVWLGRLLEREPGLEILARVSTAGQGVLAAKRLQPSLVVCDPATARHPWLATIFSEMSAGTSTRVVVIEPDGLRLGLEYAVPVVAVLRQDLPPYQMANILRDLAQMPNAGH